MTRIPSARELIAQHLGLYRRIEFKPNFRLDGDYHTLMLWPYWKGDLRNFTCWDDPPCALDLRAANIRFIVAFHGSKDKRGLLHLVTEEAWRAAKRKVKPLQHIVAEPEGSYDNPLRDERLPVKFFIEKDGRKLATEIAGFNPTFGRLEAPWEFFIPPGTPEHQAILAAISRERSLSAT